MLETIKSFPAPISCFLILSFFENTVIPHFTLEVKVVHSHISGGPEVSANVLDGDVTNMWRMQSLLLRRSQHGGTTDR